MLSLVQAISDAALRKVDEQSVRKKFESCQRFAERLSTNLQK
jgi:hypothetical protein